MIETSLPQKTEKFIRASTALNRVAKALGDRVRAQEVLADALKAGDVRAHAGWQWAVKASSIDQAWKKYRDKYDLKDVEIDPSYWQASRNWDGDRSNWRWEKNRFYVTKSSRSTMPEHDVIEGVKFSEKNVTALIQFLSSGRKELDRKSNVIPRVSDWDLVFARLIVAERVKGLDAIIPELPDARTANARLSEWMTSLFKSVHGREPSPSEAAKRAATVISALRNQASIMADMPVPKPKHRLPKN